MNCNTVVGLHCNIFCTLIQNIVLILQLTDFYLSNFVAKTSSTIEH